MAKCKECDTEFKTGIKDFCSEDCWKKNIQKRINEATANDTLHTNIISKESS